MPADNVTLGNKISTGSVMVCNIYLITRCAGFVFIGGSFQWSIGGSDLIILTQNIASNVSESFKIKVYGNNLYGLHFSRIT